MSETTHDPSGQEMPKGRPQGRLVTNYPTAPEVLVITAPNNIPMSFAQLLAMNGLTPEVIAGLQPPTGPTGATGAMGAVDKK